MNLPGNAGFYVGQLLNLLADNVPYAIASQGTIKKLPDTQDAYGFVDLPFGARLYSLGQWNRMEQSHIPNIEALEKALGFTPEYNKMNKELVRQGIDPPGDTHFFGRYI